MKIKSLTFPCVMLFAVLAIFPALAQEQPGAGSRDEAVSAEPVQPDEAGSDNTSAKGVAPSSQSTDTGSVNAGAGKPSALNAPKAAAAKTGAVADKAVRKDPPIKEAVNPQAGTGLLDVKDEEYKFIRIPGMPAIKKPDASQMAEEAAADDLSESLPDADKEKDGFLGMSKETGDTVTRVALVLLIAVIFILYRVRSKSGGRRVTRSYLKR